MQKSNSKGFTLIELLVVIAIIGLLSTLAVVALNSARQKSRDSKRVADIKQMQTALELFFADANGYPYMGASAVTLGSASYKSLCKDNPTTVAGAVYKASCAGTDTTYMGLVPQAPTPQDGTCTAVNNPYLFTSVGGSASAFSTGYTIAFCLGGQVGDLVAGAHSASPNGIQ